MLAVAGALALAAGCSGSSGSASGPEDVATPAGLSVSVLQYRPDYTLRRIQIKVTNGGTSPVTVTAARLDSTAFTGEAAWLSQGQNDDATIKPGSGTDLRALLPASACTRTTFTTTARLDLRLPDGSTGRTAALPVGDPFESVARVHSEDCRRAAAVAIAGLALVDPLRTETRDGDLIGLLDLRVTPTGQPGTLTLESIGTTTLLTPATGDVWPIDRTVTATGGPQTVTLELRPARCDPHAIAEDKLGTVMPLTLRVDGGEPGVVTVPADPDLRIQIQQYVHRACSTS